MISSILSITSLLLKQGNNWQLGGTYILGGNIWRKEDVEKKKIRKSQDVVNIPVNRSSVKRSKKIPSRLEHH